MSEKTILFPISLETLERIVFENVEKALSKHQPAPTNEEGDERFSILELAEYLKCTKATIHSYKNRGIFPFYQIGRTVYFIKSEVDAALVNNKKGGHNG